MRLIAQKNYSGCSVACVASVLNVNYRDALELFPPNGDPEKKGFYCHEIVEALYRGNQAYNWGYIKSIGQEKFNELIYTIGNIVYVDNSQGLPRGHYLVRVSGGWMNSWANFREWPATAATVKELPGNPLYVVYALERV